MIGYQLINENFEPTLIFEILLQSSRFIFIHRLRLIYELIEIQKLDLSRVIQYYQFILMGGTTNKEQQQQEISNPLSIEDLNQLEKAKLVSDRLYSATRNIYQYCIKGQIHQLSNAIKTLTEDLANSNLPLCLKKTKKYYVCKSCWSDEVYICQTCFPVHLHIGHNYLQIQTEYFRTCSCGNSQVSANPPACQAHRLKECMVSQQSMVLFKNQFKYLFKIALAKVESKPSVIIPQKFRNAIISSLLTVIKEKVKKNNQVAESLQQILFGLGEEQDKMESRDVTLFQNIVLAEQDQIILTTISQIISSIVRSTARKDRITQLYFHWMLSSNPKSVKIIKVFKDSQFKPSDFPQSYEKYLLKSGRQQLHMQPLDFTKLDWVWQKYEMLAHELIQIFHHRSHKSIVTKMFQTTKFTDLLNFQNYYKENNQLNSNINKINLIYSLLGFRIVRILVETAEGRRQIQAIIRDIYNSIINKTLYTFDRSLQRIFAFIVCLLFEFRIPNKTQLERLIGQEVETATANQLIIQSVDFKNNFASEYRELVAKGDVMKSLVKNQFALAQIIATDEVFIKIFANCLSEDYLFKQYIDQKLSQVFNLNQLSLQNIREPLRKLPQLFNYFQIPLQNNFSQLILSANTQHREKDSDIILFNLLSIWENSNSFKFKSIADNFIASEQNTIEFIKNNAIIENKKIKLKTSNPLPLLFISPSSQYFFEELENQIVEKILQNRLNKFQASEAYRKVFNAKTLKSVLNIWQKCLNIIESNKFDSKKHQKQLVASINSLANLYFGTKISEIKEIIQRLVDKLSTQNPRVQIYLKYILQNKNGEEKEKQRGSEKKKQMMNALKQKQKQALQNFKLQQKCKIDLQCIFCKNSIQGEPYLLGHFKYNNFYSKKILQMNVPFIQFTTCGHSAHEKCLIQMNKGDFRIWYPCILCKSITNILLPIANAQLNEEKRLAKILDFLKNFAANYTFFFQSNKQLVEFDLNDIVGVYKLLFKTMVYSLTIYPIANYSYFERSQLPILKFIFDLLIFSFKKLKNLSVGAQTLELKVNNDFATIFNYHKFQLQAYITGNEHSLSHQRKIDLHRDRISQELTPLFDQIYQYLNDERDKVQYEVKDEAFKDSIKVTMFKPPQDLNDLRNKKLPCSACSKVDDQIEICVLCEWNCCSQCKDVRKVHALQAHLGETVFVNGYNGKYTYIHEQLSKNFNSVYLDYLGNEANDKKLLGVREFLLSEFGWNKVVNDIICNRLHKEIMRVQA